MNNTQRTLNILLVSDVYPPIIGGAELQTQLLGKKLQERGHTVNIATSWQVGLAERELDGKVTVYRVKGLSSLVPWFSGNPNRRHHPPLADPGAVRGLQRVLAQTNPDVVHSYGWITYSMATALHGHRAPLIVAMREYAHTCALRTMLHNGTTPCSGPELGKCLRCATSFYGLPKGLVAMAGVEAGKHQLRQDVGGVHAISTYMQDIAWRDLFNPDHSTHVQPGQGNNVRANAIVPSFRNDIPEVADPATLEKFVAQLPSEPYILFVGAMRRVKGVEVLLEAYTRLRNAPPLVFAGVPTPDTPKTFPEGVCVLANVPHSVVMELWTRSMFGVAPSLWPEPFGNVIHEAMSKSKPIIGTTPGGHTDMILHGETGFLVKPGDADSLTEAMQQLIDSPELRERMGKAALQRSKLFGRNYRAAVRATLLRHNRQL